MCVCVSNFCFSHSRMASLFRFITLFFFVASVLCDEKDDKILKAINDFRQGKNISGFSRNENAACLARKLVQKLRDEPCTSPDDFNKEVGSDPNFSDLRDLFSKCRIASNSSVDGIILPACVPGLDPQSVLHNFTRSHDLEYLLDKNFTSAGVRAEDKWVVLILGTDTSTGNFTSSNDSSSSVGCVHSPMALFLGLLLFLLCSIL